MTQVKYSGEFPSLIVKKTTEQVIDDTIRWAKLIANNNRFHYGVHKGDEKKYGTTGNANHNGCYFCDTQKISGGRSKKGIVDYQLTYCCNPFVHAAWSHGGQVPSMLTKCQKASSFDFGKGKGYDKSSMFTNLGHPSKSLLKKGDVLCNDHHVAIYVGDGKIAEASGGDDNKRNSTKWNNSIHVVSLTDSRYKSFPRVHRFNSSVNKEMVIIFGEVNDRVKLLQKFLNWYGDYKLAEDGIFFEGTLAAVKDFQKKMGLTADGKFGSKSLAKAKECTKEVTPSPIPPKPPKKKYSGTFPKLPTRKYFKRGDKGEQVRNLQRFLNWFGNYGLVVDGVIGSKTILAVEKFQKANKLAVDGLFGKKCLAKAKTIEK